MVAATVLVLVGVDVRVGVAVLEGVRVGLESHWTSCPPAVGVAVCAAAGNAKRHTITRIMNFFMGTMVL